MAQYWAGYVMDGMLMDEPKKKVSKLKKKKKKPIESTKKFEKGMKNAGKKAMKAWVIGKPKKKKKKTNRISAAVNWVRDGEFYRQ